MSTILSKAHLLEESYGPSIPISQEIHQMKYRQDGETFARSMQRIARTLSDDSAHESRFFDALVHQRFLPAGRVQTAIGSERKTTAQNCLGGETEIVTREYGSVAIRDVVGKTVHVIDGTGAWCLAEIKDFGVQPLHRVVLTTSANGKSIVELRATLGHAWIVNGERVKTGSLRPKKMRVDALDYHKMVENDEEYVAGVQHGFLYGDGTKKKDENGYFVRICKGKEEIADYFDGLPFSTPPSGEGDQVFYLYGDNYRPGLKELPEPNVVSADYLLGFMRGWMASDGCVNGAHEVTMCMDDSEEAWIRRWGPLVGFTPMGSSALADTTNFGRRNKASRNVRLSRQTICVDDFIKTQHREWWREPSLPGFGIRYIGAEPVAHEPVYCAVVPTTASFALAAGIHSGNCYVSGVIEDDSESIMKAVRDAFMTMRMGGGIGYNFSNIRPHGDKIKSLDSRASGPLSFMNIFDATCATVASAGHRRGAQMGILNVNHPDIEAFVQSKQNTSALRNFNISIGMSDEFMQAVDADGNFDLRFDGRVYKTIRARTLWDDIMRSTWDWAEPGIIFLDTVNRMNNLWYCENIQCTNPCVSGDTTILTDRGHIRIDELVGQSVRVWNGCEWSTVTPRITGRDQSLVQVVLSNGLSLDCTPYHKFVLDDGSRVEAKDLDIGMKLAKSTRPVIEGGEDDPHAWEQGFFSGDGFLNGKDYPWVYLYGDKQKLVDRFDAASHPSVSRDGRLLVRLKSVRDKTFVPDTSWSVKSRLDWFAGLSDSDGVAVWDKKSCAIQVSSIDRKFLTDVSMMLQTLGIQPSIALSHGKGVKSLPDGKGGWKEYDTKDCFRLMLSAWDVKQIQLLGFKTHRLDIDGNDPARNAARFPAVTAIIPKGGKHTVYCFEEPKNHTGVFAGIMTAQCGEQPLPSNGACLLGSFNMVKYVSGGRLDWIQFGRDIADSVRAMDNVIDETIYPLPEQAREQHTKRRMGLGVTGMANAIESFGYSYGDPNYINMQNAILEELRNCCYQTSVRLAQEKGSFALFDRRYLDGAFVRTLPRTIRESISHHGIRNSHLTSIAPTGCLIPGSLVHTSSGLKRIEMLGDAQGPQWQDLTCYVMTDHGSRRATQFYVNGEADVWTVKTTRGYEITGTGKHQIKVVDQQGRWSWRRFDEMTTGVYAPIMLEASTGNPAKVSLPPIETCYHTSRSVKAPATMNADLAVLVGLFTAGGSLHDKGLRFSLTTEDSDLVKWTIDTVQTLFGLQGKLEDMGGSQTIYVNSVALRKWWAACGFAKTSETHGKGYWCSVSDAVLNTNDTTVYAAYLRGLYAGDGSTAMGLPNVTNKSITFIREVQTLLTTLGVVSRIDSFIGGKSGRPVYRLNVTSRRYAKIWKDRIGFLAVRKHGKIVTDTTRDTSDYVPLPDTLVDELCGVRHELREVVMRARRAERPVARWVVEQLLEETGDDRLEHALKFFYDPIDTVNQTGRSLTYDISVPDNVTYIANGFVSHNTISLTADNVSSGIEPVFSYGFDRIIQTFDGPRVERVDDYGVRVFGVHGRTADQCTVADHVGVLISAAQWVDSAVSKTCNIGSDVSFEDFKDVYRAAWIGGAKGCTTFRSSGKRMGILQATPSEQEDGAACRYDPETGTRSCDQ